MKAKLLPLALLFLGTSLSADPCVWKVDPVKSKITVAVTSTADDFTATLGAYTAEMAGDTAASPAVASVKVGWNMSDLDTADAKRDKHMKEWFDPAAHPSNSWSLTKFETRDGKTFAQGRLSLHGVTKDLEVPCVLTRPTASTLTVEGSARFDHRDFGLPKIRSFLVLTVDPVVRVNFHLEASAEKPGTKASPSAVPTVPKANP